MNRYQSTIVYIILTFVFLRFIIEFLPKSWFIFFSSPTKNSNNPLLPSSLSSEHFSDSSHHDSSINGIIYYCDQPAYQTNIWCTIPPPTTSLFRFPSTTPFQLSRWKLAQNHAIDQKPILLERILSHYITNDQNFLDGDTLFRFYHQIGDYYVDDNYHFDILDYDNQSVFSSFSSFSSSSSSLFSQSASKNQQQQQQQQQQQKEKIQLFERNIQKMLTSKPRKKYDWEERHNLQRNQVVPEPYPFYHLTRVPIFHLGYFVFPKRDNLMHFFQGPSLGEVTVDRGKLMRLWSQSKNKIKFPWIAFHAANENWGILSTYFPNRTTNWGQCCHQPQDRPIHELINHEKTIMFVTNQHSNFTHPKIITLPRGIPITNTHDRIRKLIFDSMHQLKKWKSKNNLLFTSSSTWGYRPKLMECIQKKFQQFNSDHPTTSLTFNHYGEKLTGRLTPAQYYQALGKSLFSLALPGLGYDTFRLWETMTLGSIPVLEKGVGLDKPLWRLPALLVDDFDDVTPTLLYTAYLEALYRVNEFEFERLTQSFWVDFIYNVSKAGTSLKILEKFPLASEDPNFARPFQRYTCHETNSCGIGTKRIPKSFC